MEIDLDLNFLLEAYQQGYFPMAQNANDQKVTWLAPKQRCFIPITTLSINQSVKRALKKVTFTLKYDTDTSKIIELCSLKRPERPETWINSSIKKAFIELAKRKQAHSISVYDENKEIVGGIYGLRLGRIFCAESMVSLKSNASKLALIALKARLFFAGFELLDVQFFNEHLAQFRPYFLSFQTYKQKLQKLGPILSQNNISFMKHYEEGELKKYLLRF